MNENKCPYCQAKELRKMIRTDGTEALAIEKDNSLGILPEFVKAKINYCPMCGRNLMEENNEQS